MEAGGERHRTARTAHTAGRTARGRTRIGVALVMVLCGVLFATTARLSGGGSIRDESSDVVGVLQERGRDIERLTEENAAMRAEVEGLRGAEAGAPTAEGAEHIADADPGGADGHGHHQRDHAERGAGGEGDRLAQLATAGDPRTGRVLRGGGRDGALQGAGHASGPCT